MDAVTTLAGVCNGVDYHRDGLTLERMGLSGFRSGDVGAYAREGTLRP